MARFITLSSVMVLMGVSLPDLSDEKAAPVPVVIGEAIGPFRLGMTLEEAKKASRRPLAAEGIERAGQTGWTAGPILLLIEDATGKVDNVSLELHKSPGVRIGKIVIPREATLDAIQKLLPGCTMEKGSGGRALTCKAKSGRTLHIYDSYMDASVWVMLP